MNRTNSVFPKARGRVRAKNEQGQLHLDDILTNPNARAIWANTRRFGKIVDVEIDKLGGVRFSEKGKFIGFLEP